MKKLLTTACLFRDPDAIFQVVAEATEEAIYNSLLRATTVHGAGHEMQAISIDEVRRILKKYGRGK
ncbi:MAG: P1 family peptidase [Blastocatellia bacterium]|nr:P1 family peptidase [Blastocatellia bacterium]